VVEVGGGPGRPLDSAPAGRWGRCRSADLAGRGPVSVSWTGRSGAVPVNWPGRSVGCAGHL